MRRHSAKLLAIFLIHAFSLTAFADSGPDSSSESNAAVSRFTKQIAESTANERMLVVTATVSLSDDETPKVRQVFLGLGEKLAKDLMNGVQFSTKINDPDASDAPLEELLGNDRAKKIREAQTLRFLSMRDETNVEEIEVLDKDLNLSDSQKLQAFLSLTGASDEMQLRHQAETGEKGIPPPMDVSRDARLGTFIDRLKSILTEDQLNRFMQFEAEDGAGKRPN